MSRIGDDDTRKMLREFVGYYADRMVPKVGTDPSRDPIRALGQADLERARYYAGVNRRDDVNVVVSRQEYEALREQLKEYVAYAERMGKVATTLGTVLRGAKEGKIVLSVKGNQVEVGVPENGMKLAPGDTVRVSAETLQITGKVPDVQNAGEIMSVVDVMPGAIEIERGGSPRRVACDLPVKVGERVVLDPSGNIVVANLGKPKAGFTVGEATGVSWDDIAGLEDAKRQMRLAIEGPVVHKDRFARLGIRPVKGILLHGTTGCGKTMLAKAAATALATLHGKNGGAFFYVKGPEILDPFVGASESKVRQLFQRAREHEKEHGYPAIICIDEAEAILGRRGGRTGSSLNSTLVPMFLAEMDGLDSGGAIVILLTNRPDTLDPAIVRDGRIDQRIRIGRPSRASSHKILAKRLGESLATLAVEQLFSRQHHLYEVLVSGREVPESMRLEHIVNGAMVARLADRAMSFALHRQIADESDGEVTEADVHAAIAETIEQSKSVDHEDDIQDFAASLGGVAVATHRGKLPPVKIEKAAIGNVN